MFICIYNSFTDSYLVISSLLIYLLSKRSPFSQKFKTKWHAAFFIWKYGIYDIMLRPALRVSNWCNVYNNIQRFSDKFRKC